MANQEDQIDSAEAALKRLWESPVSTCQEMQVTLGFIRANHGDDDREDISRFLAETRGVPDDAVAVVSAQSVSLLTDKAGYLLGFA